MRTTSLDWNVINQSIVFTRETGYTSGTRLQQKLDTPLGHIYIGS